MCWRYTLKQRKNAQFIWTGLILLALAILFLLLRPGKSSYASPSGHLRATIYFPNILSQILTKQDSSWGKKMRVKIHLNDLKSSNTVIIHDDTFAYLLGDGGEYPRDIVWGDNNYLIYRYAFGPSQRKKIFIVSTKPLRFRIKSDSAY